MVAEGVEDEGRKVFLESEIIRISRAADFARASSRIMPQRSRAFLIIAHLEV